MNYYSSGTNKQKTFQSVYLCRYNVMQVCQKRNETLFEAIVYFLRSFGTLYNLLFSCSVRMLASFITSL